MCAPHSASQPSLTGLAHLCLLFLHCQPPAASRPCVLQRSHSQSGSCEHTGAPFQSGGARSPAHGLSLVSRGCRSVSLPSPLCRWLPLPGAQSWWLPPPSVYLPISVRGFMAPHFVPHYSVLEMFICTDPDVSSWFHADSVDIQDGLVPIQLDSEHLLKKGSPTPPPS